MDFTQILEETKSVYESENLSNQTNEPISLSVMYEHFKKIDTYILSTVNGKKGAERGKLLGNINNKLKSIIEDEDLMMFILESLSDEINDIDDF
jgi:hypothetical protein